MKARMDQALRSAAAVALPASSSRPCTYLRSAWGPVRRDTRSHMMQMPSFLPSPSASSPPSFSSSASPLEAQGEEEEEEGEGEGEEGREELRRDGRLQEADEKGGSVTRRE